MAKGPDPRKEPVPIEDVPRLVLAGAGEYGERRFWHAHEAWESAWHALRAAGHAEEAGYLQGMILITAALENAIREKEAGFKRQFAQGLHMLHAHEDGAAPLGVRHPRAWERDLAKLYADACRQLDWPRWNAGGWRAPPLEVG